VPPENAPSCEQGYGISVASRHGMYIGMYQYFNSDSGVIDLILAWSYDGEHWNLNWDERVLAAGNEGDWDAGMVFGPEFLDTGDGRVCLYYGSLGVDHTQPDGEALASGEAQGDGCAIAAPIDLTPYAGEQVVLAFDLTEGELFSVSL